MKILIASDLHGNTKELQKFSKKKLDAILCAGDAGKANLARERFFENEKRKKRGLSELEYDKNFEKSAYKEIYDSTISAWKMMAKIAPTYSILGNVGMDMIYDSNVKKDEKKYRIKLPYLRRAMNKIKNFHFVRNRVRKIGKLRVGFLEYFSDVCWFKEYNDKDKKRIARAIKQTDKVRKILKNFGKLDILVCHQPPYGYLDQTNNPHAPKDWKGKHAGSKAILDYIKKYQPKYVFCGHIHEGVGKAKIGKTEVYNIDGCKVIEL